MTLRSLPVILKELSVKLIFPSSSPSLNSPDDDKKIPFPEVSVGLEPNCIVPAVESTSKLSVSKINEGTRKSTEDPDIKADDAVICPEDFNLRYSFADFISVESIAKFAIVPAVLAVIVFAVISPVIFAAEAVICPEDFNLRYSFADFISVESTSKLPIDAETNLANPVGFISAR